MGSERNSRGTDERNDRSLPAHDRDESAEGIQLAGLRVKDTGRTLGLWVARLCASLTLAVSVVWGMQASGMEALGGLFWAFGQGGDDLPRHALYLMLVLWLTPWVPPALSLWMLFRGAVPRGIPLLALEVMAFGYLVLVLLWGVVGLLGLPPRNVIMIVSYNYGPCIVPLIAGYPAVLLVMALSPRPATTGEPAEAVLGGSPARSLSEWVRRYDPSSDGYLARTAVAALAVLIVAWLYFAPMPAPASSSARSTPVAAPSPGPQPTPLFGRPEATITTVQQRNRPVFGPSNGVIPFSGVGVRTAEAVGSTRNFLAEVKLHEPVADPGLSYAAGFKFGEDDDGTGYFVYFTLRDRAGWYLQQTNLVNDAPKSSILLYRPGILYPQKVGNEKFSELRLLVDGERGVLVVNGSVKAEMELPDSREGKISLAVGMLRDDYSKEKAGSARYQDFTVWVIP